jgi:hypothetical protein
MADDDIGVGLVQCHLKNLLVDYRACRRFYVLSKLLRSMRSFFIGEIKPLPLAFAFASKLGGKRSSGRTKVCTAHGRLSGGVGSSITTVRLNTHE